MTVQDIMERLGINQTGRAIECFLILLVSFLLLNLLITNTMEIINRLVLKSKKYS